MRGVPGLHAGRAMSRFRYSAACKVEAVRRVVELDGTTTWDTVLRVPFSAVGRSAPAAGERWLGNFFRIDRHPLRGDEYSAWRPTLRTPPDFHVPEAFGLIEFQF